MGRTALLICALAILASCSTTAEKEEVFSERWVGHSEDDVFLRYGKPADVVTLSSGNRVDSYHDEGFAGGSYANQTAGASSFGSYFCDRRFEVDKASGKVVRVSITGNRCDYKR